MNKLFVALTLFLFLSTQLSGQSIIKGNVSDASGEALAYANVLLNNAADSTLHKVEITDAAGLFNFQQIKSGDYFISISYVGLAEYGSDAFSLSGNDFLDLKDIVIEANKNDLSEVTVTAKRPMIEVKPDKLVFNIENSVNASGNNALELLRKAPGVVLDNNENINLMGKSGVRVYINDRPSYLSPQDLANYLRTLNSDQIEAIEIITNPSARYDAEGNAGIINIKLKKNKNHGTNGSISVNGSFGIDTVDVSMHPSYGATVSLNHRNKFINVYGSYGYNENQGYNFERLSRTQNESFFDQRILTNNGNTTHVTKLGLDYFLNEKSTIGFLINGNFSETSNSGKSDIQIGPISTNQIEQTLVSQSITGGPTDNVDLNLNYQFKGDNDLVWNIDADYGIFSRDNDNTYPNTLSNAITGIILSDSTYADDQLSDINIYSFRLDHERNLAKGKLGIGIKTALVETNNSFDFFNEINNVNVIDLERSNDFDYSENVNAAYVTYDLKKDKWSYQLGLRIENSRTKGELFTAQVVDNELVERDFTDWFPSGGVSYAVDQNNQLAFAFGRRVDRPNYQNLNPFVYLINELSVSTGDPFLRPQYTNNIQLTHTFKYRFNTTIKFSNTTDLMTRFSDVNEDIVDNNGKVIGEKFTWKNLDTQNHYSINFSAPLTVKEWWSTYTNLTVYRLENKADFGEGKVVDITANALNIYMQHTFTLPKDFMLEVSGWGNTPGIWGGNFETGGMWSIGAGLQKKVFNGAGTLKVGIDDIFNSSVWTAETTLGIQSTEGLGGWSSRRVKASFNYNFGNDQVKSRKRKTGLEDEKKRTGS